MNSEPKKSFLRRIMFPNHPKFKVTAENVIYARKQHTDLEDESDFIILTKLGVGDFGKHSIRNIHIGMRIESTKKYTPKIEIQEISPTTQIKTVGTVIQTDNQIRNILGDIKTEFSSDFNLSFLRMNIDSGAQFAKRNNSEKIITYNLPNKILIMTSSGIGNDAMWDFKQGESIGWKSQYDLNVVFKIRKSILEIQKRDFSYYVVFDVFINDEKIEFEKNGPVKNSAPLEFI